MSRGRAGSKTVPSIQRSPALVCTLTEIMLAKSRGRELCDSTISMPRSLGDGAGIDDA